MLKDFVRSYKWTLWGPAPDREIR